ACCVIVRAREQDTNPTVEVTYAKDIAPILQRHCVACHRPNDIAPMSLMTYDEVLPFARMIRENVVQRKMPPWHADPAFGEFTNDTRLAEADIATIVAWVKAEQSEVKAQKSKRDKCSGGDGTSSPTWC